MEYDSVQEKRLRQRLAEVMRRIRSTTPRLAADENSAKCSEVWNGNLDGTAIQRVIIYLRSSGCSWAIGTPRDGEPNFKPGCFDCAHSVVGTTLGRKISSKSYVQQFTREFSRFDFSKFTTLCVYNEGSFFNDNELPRDAQIAILNKISANREIRVVVLESLPEFLTNDVLANVSEILGSRRVEVGIGLESVDPVVRKLCVNKPYTLKDFEKAVLRAKNYVSVLAYVLLKPSFTTESEAVDDAIASTKYAFSKGANVVSIEPLNLSDYNLAGNLARANLYRVPWLWSVIEVAKATAHLGELRIGGDQFAPTYRHQAQNCEKCSQRVKQQLNRFNETQSLDDITWLECECKQQWRIEMSAVSRPIIERIEDDLNQLSRELSRPGFLSTPILEQ